MPFLHWEEDRKRDKIAKVIDQATVKNRKEREEARNNAKSQRVSERTYRNLLPAKPQRSLQTPKKVDETHSQKIRSVWEEKSFGRPDVKHARNFLEFAGGFIREGTIEDERVKDGRKVWRVAKLPCDKHGRLRTQNKLGQFLLDAARLYEAMSIYRDRKLVETFFHHDPPLHPRRTLDQSYYWTLKSTKIRDMDQVVYRGTTMDYRDIHRLKVQDDCKGQRHTWHLSNLLNRKKCESVEAPERSEPENSMGVYRWDGHWVKADDIDDIACDHCRGEIRKVSRIVMVDQLWMWILDRQTIFTSFPRRIRNARKNQIRSVFDVALIVLDECSNTFFDRTKTKDRRPQVLDIFAESIGNLQNKQTVSFQHLWHWTEGTSKIYNSKSKYENTAHLHIAPLLNINPEGKLQPEVRDIIDELDIMLHVIKEQKEVIKRFVKNVESIYDPCGTWRDEAPSPDGERDYQRSRAMPMSGLNKEKLERQKEEFMWFRKQAYDLISDAGDRIAELEGLRKSAESTSQGIKDLLDLKQQQASILQAWQSVRQADESVRQGRSVMIFTIVTIIFLPLSFMSSVFGMNNRDIGETNMSFGDQAAYMFPISASVILVSIIFAFWTYPRTLLWAAYKYAETWVLVTSGIYDVFLGLKDWKTLHMTSEDWLKSLEKSVEEMKSKVKSRRTKSAGEDCQDSHSSDETVTGNAAHENFPKSISSTDERLQSSGSYC
ncbi:hypothetical protein LY78DRAFT_697445 [Colletotrichum sublineola]|nr:hypothetical protein LY78DRAFT_697445 [Colletotrichum sublineola]